jgi:rSAM/selenodomain-associated transferase 2
VPSVSIIIPTLNEAKDIAAALREARERAPEAELIVADGGSEDETVRLAEPFARVIAAPRGRASQMNAAAAQAQGDWLLFLHADTRLPAGFAEELARAARLGYRAGAFRLRIDGRHPLLPLLAWGATLRTRWRGIALGDQALFLEKRLFWGLDGFAPLALMEDYALALRLKREGIPLYLARLPVITSGRRWDELGFFRVWWRMRCHYWAFARNEPRFEKAAAAMRREYRDVR